MSTKINKLFQQWPKRTVATQNWLSALGISRALANWHVRSGWLERFGPRAFVRPGEQVDWQGGLYALQQQLRLTVRAGARTALELQGLAHYLPIGANPVVFLVSDGRERLPSWFTSRRWNVQVRHRCLSLFTSIPEGTSSQIDCGGFQVIASSPERAMLEAIRLATTNAAIEHAHLLMDALTTLRPSAVQQLLETCRSVKVKRFFLWSAATHEHAWVNRLDLTGVDLGKGKRHLYKGGVFDHKYQITVPKPETVPDV